MRKSAYFVFVFTFLVVFFSISLKSEYIDFSQKAFGKTVERVQRFGDDLYSLINKSQLLEENERLKAELSRIKSLDEENKLIKQENEQLHKMLSLQKKTPYKNKKAANIVALNTFGEFSLIADKGKNSGIKKDDIALWGNALVGKVEQVYSDICYITPITAPDFCVGIINENEDAGLISGESTLCDKNMCRLSFFSNAAESEKDASIFTSGLSDVYPEGIVIGKIQKQNGEAFVKTEVDFFKIRTIHLISSG